MKLRSRVGFFCCRGKKWGGGAKTKEEAPQQLLEAPLSSTPAAAVWDAVIRSFSTMTDTCDYMLSSSCASSNYILRIFLCITASLYCWRFIQTPLLDSSQQAALRGPWAPFCNNPDEKYMHTPVCLACWHLLDSSGKVGDEEKMAECDHRGCTNNIFHQDCLFISNICIFS